MWTKNELLEIKRRSEMHIERLVHEANERKDDLRRRDANIRVLEKDLAEKDAEIERLKGEVECQRKSIERMSRQLTEHELFEKKMKEVNNNGGITNAEVVKRMCRLEAQIEAQENPYFF